MKLAARAMSASGEAKSLIYFGDHVRMRCNVREQDKCFVKVPLGSEALDTFAPGAPIALEFAPSTCACSPIPRAALPFHFA